VQNGCIGDSMGLESGLAAAGRTHQRIMWKCEVSNVAGCCTRAGLLEVVSSGQFGQGVQVEFESGRCG